MRILSVIFLLALTGAVASAQVATDTLVYASKARLTTVYNLVYLGPKGIQKQVTVTFDTTGSTQTVSAVIGNSADTINTAKVLTVRLAYWQGLPIFGTTKDTLCLKVDGASVLSTVFSIPYPRALSR